MNISTVTYNEKLKAVTRFDIYKKRYKIKFCLKI